MIKIRDTPTNCETIDDFVDLLKKQGFEITNIDDVFIDVIAPNGNSYFLIRLGDTLYPFS